VMQAFGPCDEVLASLNKASAQAAAQAQKNQYSVVAEAA
jgi:hypothetical protein